MNDENVVCPTDGVPINENKVRTVAFLVLLTALLYLTTGWPVLPVLLAVDFGLRSFNAGKYSPFGIAADGLVKQFRLPYKATDQAPKRFAARIGLAFSLAIALTQFLGGVLPFVLAGILAGFAGLESLAGFCAGCYGYTYYLRWFAPKSLAP